MTASILTCQVDEHEWKEAKRATAYANELRGCEPDLVDDETDT